MPDRELSEWPDSLLAIVDGGDPLAAAGIGSISIGERGEAADAEGVPALTIAPEVPDTIIDAGVVGPVQLRAVSLRGIGHRVAGTPRQDEMAVDIAGPDANWLVVAVADGVSAGARSHIASRLVARRGVRLLVEHLATSGPDTIDWDGLVGTLAGAIVVQGRREQEDDTLDARAVAADMATTVAFAIVPVVPDGDGDGHEAKALRTCIVLPIGDTSVWVLRAGTAWSSVTAIKNAGSDVASSATAALPLLPPAALVPTTVTVAEDDVLFVLSDGVGDPLGDGSGEVGEVLARLWAQPPNKFEFAAEVDFGRRSHTDDRTAVGLWFR